MPREPNPKIEQAKGLYKKGFKLIEIAEKLGVPEGTVRSWKNRYKWDSEDNATLRKEDNKKRNVAKGKSPPKTKDKEADISQEIKQLEETEITFKQKLFCVYYSKCFNATKAYQKAYGASYDVANAEGWKLLVNPRINAEIQKIKQNKLNRAMLSGDDIFQKMIDIAFSDITDYVEFGKKQEIKKRKDGSIDTIEYNYIDLKEYSEVDGSLISEISEGKNGISVKLYDKMKALQWLADRMDLLPVATKKRLEIEQAKLVLQINESRGEKESGNKLAEAAKKMHERKMNDMNK